MSDGGDSDQGDPLGQSFRRMGGKGSDRRGELAIARRHAEGEERGLAPGTDLVIVVGQGHVVADLDDLLSADRAVAISVLTDRNVHHNGAPPNLFPLFRVLD